jgi:flagellar biosynthesis protein FlhF
MRVKSYYAATVESAIMLARQEMGEDAMLIHSRKAPAEARHLGAYEVVFGTEQQAPAPQPVSAPAAAPGALAEEVAEMRRQLAKVSRQVTRAATFTPRRSTSAALYEIDEVLAMHEISRDIGAGLLRALDGLEPGALRQAFREQARDLIAVSPELGGVAALVGPPGAGKTALIAKLAVRYGVAASRSIHLISYDGHRIASAEPLRTYATIMGASFEAVDSVHALAQSLKEHSRKDLVLIDTPGYSAADFPLAYELEKFLSTYSPIEIHLVLSCAVKTSDVTRMVDRYSVFHPARLIFTKLDETDSYGAIVNESVRAGLPVSFLSAGPRVPEDLEPAARDRIVDLLIEGRQARAVATA